jgi:hypothetical protein
MNTDHDTFRDHYDTHISDHNEECRKYDAAGFDETERERDGKESLGG